MQEQLRNHNQMQEQLRNHNRQLELVQLRNRNLLLVLVQLRSHNLQQELAQEHIHNQRQELMPQHHIHNCEILVGQASHLFCSRSLELPQEQLLHSRNQQLVLPRNRKQALGQALRKKDHNRSCLVLAPPFFEAILSDRFLCGNHSLVLRLHSHKILQPLVLRLDNRNRHFATFAQLGLLH